MKILFIDHPVGQILSSKQSTSAVVKCISALEIRAVSESFLTFLLLRLSTCEALLLTDWLLFIRKISLSLMISLANDLIWKHCNGRQRCTRSTFIFVCQFNGRIQHKFQTKSSLRYSREEGSSPLLFSFRMALLSPIRKLRNPWVSVGSVWVTTKRMPMDFQKRWSIVLNAEIPVRQHEGDRSSNGRDVLSGHPSCLQYSDQLVKKIRTIHWQCIDCKRCIVCSKGDDSVSDVLLLLRPWFLSL